MLPLILGAAGGVMNLIGAYGKKNEAQNQLDAQRQHTMLQRNKFESGYGDLINKARGATLYQGDLSKYNKVEQQADLAKRMASGMSRGAGEQIARDQASQTSANVLAAATRGAGSGTDIMTAALASQQGENAAQNAISARSAEQQFAMQNQADQAKLAALGQTAAADMRERGMEYSSLASRQQNVLGLSQQKLEGGMALEQNLFDQEQAKASALADARGAVMGGWGNILGTLGSGLMGMQNQKANMSMLEKIYGGGKQANQGTMNKLGSFFTSGQFNPTGQGMFGSPSAQAPVTASAPAPMYSSESPYSEGLMNATFGVTPGPKMPVYQGGFDMSILPYLTRQ